MDERERASFERLVLGALNWMLGKLLDPNNKEDMEYYKDWAMRQGEYLDRRNQSD